jgi:hypothetical protein
MRLKQIVPCIFTFSDPSTLAYGNRAVERSCDHRLKTWQHWFLLEVYADRCEALIRD